MFGFSWPTTAPRSPRPAARVKPGLNELEAREVPAVAVLNEIYSAPVGGVLTVPKERGLLANDFSTTDAGAVLTVVDFGELRLTDNQGNLFAQPFPANSLTVNPDGSFTFIFPSTIPVTALRVGFSYTVENALDPSETAGRGFVRIYPDFPGRERIAVGTGPGSASVISVFDQQTGNKVQTFDDVYEDSFTGGVRVASGDLNKDGYPEVVVAPGLGGAPRIKIYDGFSSRVIFDGYVYENTFTGGAYVTVGDFNGDGFDDVIVGAGAGGGPRVRVINGLIFLPLFPAESPFPPTRIFNGEGILEQGDLLADFFAYEETFRGGVKVAAGDVAGVGRDFIVTSPGEGGGPVVKTFDFNVVVGPPTVVESPGPNNNIQIAQPISQFGVNERGSAESSLSFFAGDGRGRDGINVTTADTDNDGRAEIVTGTATGAAVVSTYNGQTGILIAQFGVPYQAIPQSEAVEGFAGTPPASGVLLGSQAPPTSLVPGQQQGIGGAAGISANVPALANGGVTVFGFDFDGDGTDEIVLGAGPGNAPRITVSKQDGTEVTDFLAFPSQFLYGVNVG